MTASQDSSDLLEQVAFWLREAKEFKRIADLYWKADEGFQHLIDEGKAHGVVNTLIQESVQTEADLNWLYNNLAAFSVYYLSLAILVIRNPKRFSKDAPNQRLVELVEECGIIPTTIQRNFLMRIENWFSVYKNKPRREIPLRPHDLKLMKSYFTQDSVTLEQKRAIDNLFENLLKIAKSELTGTQTASK